MPRAAKRAKLEEPDTTNDRSVAGEAKHAVFTAWSIERGVEIKGVKPARLPGRGLGLVTTKKIKNGARVLFIPERAMFKPDCSIKASPQAQLALSVMRADKHADSSISTWTATWPTDSIFEHSMPMRWQTDLRALLPPPVKQPLVRQEEDYSNDLEAANEYLSAEGHSREEFRYYWSIVNSRSFHWKPKGKAGSMVLCPFIDYINHSPSGTTCDVYQRSNGYEVIADKDYAPGEEILANYGAHNNDKLLVHYGFMCTSPPITSGDRDAPNHDDDIRLDHVLLPSLTTPVRDQLQDVGFLGGHALLPATNDLCFKTQVAVRAMLLTCNEWEYYVTNGEDLAEDQLTAVKEFIRPLLQQYQKEARSKSVALGQRVASGKAAEENELALLQTRWSQIDDAIAAFLEV